jgi:hypothetical protein
MSDSAENDAPLAESAHIAADVIEEFAAPTGGEDTPEFAAFLAEFPSVASRANLKVILWRLAEHLRSSPRQASVIPPEVTE